jgi:hypothetical protein
VQFDERAGRRAGTREHADVADAREFLPHACAVDAHRVESFFERKATGVDEASHHVGREARTFFVGEERHRQWVVRGDVTLRQRLDDLETESTP